MKTLLSLLIAALLFQSCANPFSVELPDRHLNFDFTMPAEVQTSQDVLPWVATRITYALDTEVHGKADFWQTPSETLSLMSGDCEDSTILAMAMLAKFGQSSTLLLTHLEGRPTGTHVQIRTEGVQYDLTTGQLEQASEPIDEEWSYERVQAFLNYSIDNHRGLD